MKLAPCPECGAPVPDIDGPTHEYFGASAGCWKVFGEILAKEYSDPAYMAVHRLTVDSYAVQHPGKPEPRAIQSVNVHLLALYLTQEKRFDFPFVTEIMGKIIEKKKGDFLWLEPSSVPYAITVADVVKADSPKEHGALVEKWAKTTWEAWALHHSAIVQLATGVL